MRKKYLKVKVWLVHFLQMLGFLPQKYYPCEIELSKIMGSEWAEFFRLHEPLD